LPFDFLEVGLGENGQLFRFTRLVRYVPTDLPANILPSKDCFSFNSNDGNGYVAHCHIVEHEDNEIMRLDEVKPNEGVLRVYVQGVGY
jgi:hypothetical protein